MNNKIQLLVAEHRGFRIVFGVACLLGQLIYISLNLLAPGIGAMLATGLHCGRGEQHLPGRYGSIYHDSRALTRRFLPGAY